MILASLLLALGAGFYTATHFAMNTNSGKLISADVGWRKRQDNFDRLFPQQSDLILVVVDGATPELAEAGAGALTARLSQNKTLFPDVSRPDGGPFFDHNGMLFLPLRMCRPPPSNCSRRSLFWARWRPIRLCAA